MYLHDVAIRRQFTTAAQADIFFAGVGSEAPLQTLEDLLSSRELELSTTDGFDDVRFVGVLGANADQDLANVNPGGNPNGFAVRVAHPGRQSIGAGTTQHLVGAEHVIRMGPNANVEAVLTNVLDQVLVDGDTTRLKSFA